MENNQNLLRGLFVLRDQLKARGKSSEGRAPIVCTDEAMSEIARLEPRTLNELLCVPGLGQTFVDKYGLQFLEVILRYSEKTDAASKNMSPAISNTMRELEKKLVNINRRNRLLYMPKLSANYAFDLFDPERRYDPFDILFRGKTVKVCELSQKSKVQGQSGQERYKRMVSLLREVNKDLREKGQFDLYIGYPFVKGRLVGENFDVRAPLALFPVEVFREADYISFRLDDTRDVVYNNNLILAHYKFNNIKRPLPSNTIEDISIGAFMSNLLSYYETEGVKIDCGNTSLSKFKDFMAGEFPQYTNGEMWLDDNIVLGKFPTYSSSLQKDFNEILENGVINQQLVDLLSGIDDIDYYSDSFAGDMEIEKNERPLTISEHELNYIGDLNSSQENVISAIKKKEALVIQGPPGTGKSQTITSLISDFVSNGSNVLMVSEKKAALDVVYSRLGELNKYALLIDDVNDKQGFYSQMERILNIKGANQELSSQIDGVANSIDANVKRLELIAETLYAPNSFGIETYKLYLTNKRLDMANPDDEAKYRLLKSLLPQELFGFRHGDLSDANAKFKNDAAVNGGAKYIEITALAPWFDLIRENLSEYELLQCKDEAQALSELINEWQRKNCFVRLFTKRKVSQEIKAFAQKHFVSFNPRQLRDMMSGVFDANALSEYSEFVIAKRIFMSFSQDQKLYFDCIIKTSKALACNLFTANNELYDLAICDYLFRFEAENRDVLQYVNDFNSIIIALSLAIAQKKALTKQRLESILWQDLGIVISSKRQGEIARVVESKRKWSVNKFLNKFSFELFRGVKIWLMTPEVASEILPLQVGLFDLVIFDEASQMYVEKGIPAILRAKKVVIAGDSKQLRPSNLGAGRIEMDDDMQEETDSNAALEEESLLDVARFKYVPPVVLNFHYRSKSEELISFSNYAFYRGGLYVSPNVVTPEYPPIEVHKVEDGLWVNRSNMSEATEIVRLLKLHFQTRQANETIGIITFNSNQRDLIDDLIDEECAHDQSFLASVKAELTRKENGEDIGLFVKNIENVQGDERDVIMFSIGYAKNENGKLVRNFGWLNQKGGENRLNVAISRSKLKIHIVTSFEPFELQVEDAKNDGPKYLKKYLEYCCAVSECNKDAAHQVLLSFGDSDNNGENVRFDSDFENQVYDALRDRGFNVETQIGIGGYSIDLAIKRDDKYILGIECDGKLYHSSKSARERDYHRQKYLESRGWTIYRIWSPNWWRNPRIEIDKIVSVIASLQ